MNSALSEDNVVPSNLKPPIEPDLKFALPLASILADAFSAVVPTPAIFAGVNIELAEKVPSTVTSLVIVPPVNNISEAETCPPADTLNFDDEIIETGSSAFCEDDN